MGSAVNLKDNGLAVVVRNAVKSYVRNKTVLNDLNMSIPAGSIYSLLGASGCGKTTILSCIVGLMNLDSGTIEVHGHRPGTKESGIPGKTLGYMTQDLALYQVFTIKQIFYYFARIYGMEPNYISARMEFLIGFLDLPDSQSYIQILSGGQQRRVSLALAMLHKPSLLILDEPTVGLDPVLRENIWKYLHEVVTKQRITCLMTTHYIEEAKESDMVGIMRNGRLLVEKPPNDLLEKYGTSNLEKVFLLLCKLDEKDILKTDSNFDSTSSRKCKSVLAGQEDNNNVTGMSYRREDDSVQVIVQEHDNGNQSFKRNPEPQLLDTFSNHTNKVKAVVIKNYIHLIKTPWFLIVLLLIPPFQVWLLELVVGHTPKQIALGIVDQEVPSDVNLLQYCKTIQHGCFSNETSCQFINNFSEDEFSWVVHHSEEEALESVHWGETWGYLSIPANYTQHLFDRSLYKQHMTNETLNGSTIRSRLDVSFNLKSDFVRYKVYIHFQAFIKDIATSCRQDPRAVDLPLKFHAIYGSLEPTFLRYIQPGQLMMIIILLPMASALCVIQDRKEGTLQRSVVAGLEYSHTLCGFMISEGCLICIQIALCFGILVFGLGVYIVGSIWQFLLLVFLVGIVGLSIGFLVGQLVDTGLDAFFILLGIYLPFMVSSGATWPIESQPTVAKIIYSCFPTTFAIRSLRGVFSKGWGMTHPQVWPGYLMLCTWIVVLCVLSAIVKKVRHI